ncbi:MAG TPA: mercuric reductase [Planctomycetia bacterium]|nr:mercuric reductase [Planctomycetia bacterium]
MATPIELQPFDEHNRRLAANVRPEGRRNPTPPPRYDLVVIGAGTAGLVAAAGAAALGAKTALVERHLLGGDCLNVGCVPSKGLIRAARAAAAVRAAAAFGVHVDGWRADFSAAMERMRRLRAEISPADSVARFESLGVDVYLGEAKFIARDAVVAEGATLRFKRAIIAAGARAADPEIPGLAEAGYLTNESVFSLTALPRRLAVLGGGPIGAELAQAFARFGAETTLIERSDRILAREEPDAAAIVQESLVRDGVLVRTRAKVARAERRGAEKVLHLEDGSTVVAEEVLVAAGRTPNVDGLGLNAAGVAYDLKQGVAVDDRLMTANSRIYAAGDVCSRFKFTHAADFLARTALQNAFFFGRKRASALVIPWCTYTSPEIARVGISAAEAEAAGIAIDTFTATLEENDRARLDGEAEGFARVHVRKGTDKIVGGTIVAANAGDLIGQLSLAMTQGLGVRALGSTIQPYPTQAEAIRKLGDLYNRTRLTPFAKWLLGAIVRWRG